MINIEFRNGRKFEPEGVYVHEPIATYANRRDRILGVLEAQASNPPGMDKYVPLAYRAAAQNDKFIELLLSCQDQRRELERPLSYTHAAQLGAMVAMNRVMLERGNFNYPYDTALKLDTKEGWAELYQRNIEEYGEQMEGWIIDENIHRTYSSRGVMLPLILEVLCKNDAITPVNILDVGCSANIVLDRLLKRQPYVPIADYTHISGQAGIIIGREYSHLPIGRAVGMDTSLIDSSKDSLMWLAACQHFDQMTTENVDRILNSGDVINGMGLQAEFVQDDILGPYNIADSFDLVAMFSMLYQFPPELAQIAINNALKMCTRKGFVVLQDYCSVEEDKSGRHIKMQDVRSPFTYSTIVFGPGTGDKVYQLATFQDSTCQHIANGKHLEEFIHDMGMMPNMV
ncbi:MAG: hypothetical protein Q8P72_04440 [Candidatus Roizmanbacteria bacterium]|nr:hypothetical protein [Candidatus Roizmanbacteria bacterium]